MNCYTPAWRQAAARGGGRLSSRRFGSSVWLSAAHIPGLAWIGIPLQPLPLGSECKGSRPFIILNATGVYIGRLTDWWRVMSGYKDRCNYGKILTSKGFRYSLHNMSLTSTTIAEFPSTSSGLPFPPSAGMINGRSLPPSTHWNAI